MYHFTRPPSAQQAGPPGSPFAPAPFPPGLASGDAARVCFSFLGCLLLPEPPCAPGRPRGACPPPPANPPSPGGFLHRALREAAGEGRALGRLHIAGGNREFFGPSPYFSVSPSSLTVSRAPRPSAPYGGGVRLRFACPRLNPPGQGLASSGPAPVGNQNGSHQGLAESPEAEIGLRRGQGEGLRTAAAFALLDAAWEGRRGTEKRPPRPPRAPGGAQRRAPPRFNFVSKERKNPR